MTFDRLKRIEKQKNFSKWQGEKGLYIFRHLEPQGKGKKPVAQVYADRKYLSGVFKTRKPLEFSGDMMDSNGKRTFIKFILKGEREMIIETIESSKNSE